MKRSFDVGDSLSTMVVDDNDGYRAGLVNYLRTQKGVTVVAEARDGMEAITVAQMLELDLILMDISMPGIGGLEAARIIKEQHPGVKVVLVTIHEERTYRRLADLLRVDGFICKSSVMHDFPAVLGRIRRDVN